jgi:hypothetical protein
MKLLLLKILLQRRARDEGFTLPMVIALGLVMILLGTINIVKSSEENITAISQNSSADAMAVAEVGISKYRELLNQNRILSVYNHDQWTNNSASVDYLGDGTLVNIDLPVQTCNDITTTPPGWKDDGTASAPNNTAKWWKVEENIDGTTGDDPIGEYRLISYIYDIDDNPGTNDNGQFVLNDDNQNDDDLFEFNDTPGSPNNPTNLPYNTRGILTVQGRSPDGGIAQIEVEIPLRINDLNNFAPVLWVGSGAIATPGTLNIPNTDDDDDNIVDNNIVLKSSGTGCGTHAAIAGNSNIIRDPRNLPAIISLPADSTKKNSIGTIDSAGSKITLPRPLATPDNKNDQGRFLYEVSTINVATNNLETDGIAKVTLYATGNINITGASGTTITIGNSNAASSNTKAGCVDPASTTTPPALLSFANFNCANTISTSVSSQNLEIYGSSTTTQININTNGGTVNIEGFIHAPNATLNITGSGTVNINGAVWVSSFNNTGTATVNIKRDKTDTITAAEASYKFYTTSATMTPRPLTSTPTDWVREEVQ